MLCGLTGTQLMVAVATCCVAAFSQVEGADPTVFFAIGSAPKQVQLRNVLRETWIQDCVDDAACDYRFFTDAPFKSALDACEGDFCNDDMVLTDQSLKGYTNFGTRGHVQLNYSLTHFDFDFYVRVDDDGLLCYHHFRRSLAELPSKRVIWGRYMYVHMHLQRQRRQLGCVGRRLTFV